MGLDLIGFHWSVLIEFYSVFIVGRNLVPSFFVFFYWVSLVRSSASRRRDASTRLVASRPRPPAPFSGQHQHARPQIRRRSRIALDRKVRPITPLHYPPLITPRLPPARGHDPFVKRYLNRKRRRVQPFGLLFIISFIIIIIIIFKLLSRTPIDQLFLVRCGSWPPTPIPTPPQKNILITLGESPMGSWPTGWKPRAFGDPTRNCRPH